MDLPGVPSALLEELRSAALEERIQALALVGGAVRDALLHQRHGRAWPGLADLDLVVEGDAAVLASALLRRAGPQRISHCIEHDRFGTVSLRLDGEPLDLATARAEAYPEPGMNPVVTPGSLQADLVRRDFTINAMALDLLSGHLVDPHGGQADLDARALVFLHDGSVADDPTRVIRAARYAARLDFDLSPAALHQVTTTLAAWPWSWRPGDSAEKAPPALSTRLRMELDRLFLNEPWARALDHLEAWQAMPLLDPALQQDPLRKRRLRRARSLGLPLLPALLAAATDPAASARRLQIPGQQLLWLEQLAELRHWLQQNNSPALEAQPSVWTAAIEAQGWRPEAVALAVCAGVPSWRPLLRWWGRWRHTAAPLQARDLIAAGWRPGPGLGAELQRLRFQRLDQSR